jgi:5-methyltetrahydrofolate--homocysteine methyltransferase
LRNLKSNGCNDLDLTTASLIPIVSTYKEENLSQELKTAITSCKKEEALRIAEEFLENGVKPVEILEFSRSAMQTVGDRFEAGEYFLPELMVSGDILEAIAEVLKPHLQGTETSEKFGKIVFGTVAGDIHDIAKDIVVSMLDINGFEVIDLGVDVPVETFVQAVKEHEAKMLGLSGFLTLAIDPMRDTITALKEEGLTDVKVMIGGGPINDLVCEDIGADAWGPTAMDAVSIARVWTGVVS